MFDFNFFINIKISLWLIINFNPFLDQKLYQEDLQFFEILFLYNRIMIYAERNYWFFHFNFFVITVIFFYDWFFFSKSLLSSFFEWIYSFLRFHFYTIKLLFFSFSFSFSLVFFPVELCFIFYDYDYSKQLKIINKS